MTLEPMRPPSFYHNKCKHHQAFPKELNISSLTTDKLPGLVASCHLILNFNPSSNKSYLKVLVVLMPFPQYTLEKQTYMRIVKFQVIYSIPGTEIILGQQQKILIISSGLFAQPSKSRLRTVTWTNTQADHLPTPLAKNILTANGSLPFYQINAWFRSKDMLFLFFTMTYFKREMHSK